MCNFALHSSGELRYQGIHLIRNIPSSGFAGVPSKCENVRVKTGLERDLMEGWEGCRVVSSLIRMPSEHPEVMVWLLVSVLTHESAYGCRPHGAPLNMFTYPLR